MAKSGFKKGYDPNRAVHMGKGVQVFRDTLAEHMRKLSLDAVAYVQSVLNDKTQHPKLRMVAAQEIMNRSWGSPVNSVNIQVLDQANTKDVSTLSTEELERLVMQLTPVNVLEGELVEVSDAGTGETATKNSLKQAGIDV